MQGSFALTGKDTTQIDSRILSDLADGDCVLITFPNDIWQVKLSKNGNVVYALNNSGLVAELALRIIIGSADDKYLNSRLQEFKNDASKFTLLTGIFSKRAGQGDGELATIIYSMGGGVFKRQLEARDNSEGNTEQGVVVYTMTFGNSDRAIA
jgi:hypothetical protein